MVLLTSGAMVLGRNLLVLQLPGPSYKNSDGMCVTDMDSCLRRNDGVRDDLKE